jgi:hypothetical protein
MWSFTNKTIEWRGKAYENQKIYVDPGGHTGIEGGDRILLARDFQESVEK